MSKESNVVDYFGNDYWRAANWLDEKYPSWYLIVDPDVLDMMDADKCVIGQLYLDEYLALSGFSSLPEDYVYQGAFGYGAWRLGLSVAEMDAQVWSSNANTQVWQENIRERRAHHLINHSTSKGINSTPLWDASRLSLTIHPDGSVTGHLI